jgi:hypothetical protein
MVSERRLLLDRLVRSLRYPFAHHFLPPFDATAHMKTPDMVAVVVTRLTASTGCSLDGCMNINGVKSSIYMTKPISCCVVMAADSGRVFDMLWKEGNIAERTTLAARPPQYAWIPKLLDVVVRDCMSRWAVRELTI